ncbi:phage portal protein [Pseudomonas sp. SA3-5]|uniref:Phage portal protein n=1 Tax=Pseudomonas aestuarii TaxID=3018340 RepID=A0ABT4XE90_9PSED|nr:phage portal protein [Pseudomonas aestuarii]MDA7086490.1 phage portal protein [Pseudomonas aestuarii]
MTTGNQVAVAADAQGVSSHQGATAFTFGAPESVLSAHEIFDYLECWFNGRWYEPPLSMDGLARSVKASVHLDSGLRFKRNQLSRTFIPHKLLSREAFDQYAQDYLALGNGYVEARRSMLGSPLALKPTLAKYMRVGKDGRFFQVQGWKDEHEFDQGSVFHLRELDLHQEIYGLPEWICALQSALLNQSATLFRRRYFENGSHAGFILYMTDAAQQEDDIDDLRTALKNSKGPGNFRNLFVYAPNGKKDGIQLIPVSEVAAKDEFNSIKDKTLEDVLAALRVYPQLMGIVPKNAGGFGSPQEAAGVWATLELEPIQTRLALLNDWVGEEVVRFKPFELGIVSK